MSDVCLSRTTAHYLTLTMGYEASYLLFDQEMPQSQTADNPVMGAQWLSGRVLDSRPRGRGFETHRHHCVVVLEQNTFILA